MWKNPIGKILRKNRVLSVSNYYIQFPNFFLLTLELKPLQKRHIFTPFFNITITIIIAFNRLKHCTSETPVVQWFWQAVESYSEEMRARLLQFVTGSSRVPLQGFKALQGSTGAAGPRLFTIHCVDVPPQNLPKAHTCFNRIDIPPYDSYQVLLDKLTQAVEETCGFAVEWFSDFFRSGLIVKICDFFCFLLRRMQTEVEFLFDRKRVFITSGFLIFLVFTRLQFLFFFQFIRNRAVRNG